MQIKAIKTHPIGVGEFITTILDAYVPSLKEESILAITSKIISLCQRRIVPQESVKEKYDLIRQEADAILKEPTDNRYGIYLTITDNILLPSAGIDESNGNGFYILYPEAIQATAAQIWTYLRKRDHINHLGILITDSHTTPLRRGVTGIALGWCGFDPLYNYIGKPDVFGKNLRVTQINNLDALAAAAVFAMGEGAEQTPLALITHAPRIHFLSRSPTREEEENIKISLEEDLYGPLLKKGKWMWKEF